MWWWNATIRCQRPTTVIFTFSSDSKVLVIVISSLLLKFSGVMLEWLLTGVSEIPKQRTVFGLVLRVLLSTAHDVTLLLCIYDTKLYSPHFHSYMIANLRLVAIKDLAIREVFYRYVVLGHTFKSCHHVDYDLLSMHNHTCVKTHLIQSFGYFNMVRWEHVWHITHMWL